MGDLEGLYAQAPRTTVSSVLAGTDHHAARPRRRPHRHDPAQPWDLLEVRAAHRRAEGARARPRWHFAHARGTTWATSGPEEALLRSPRSRHAQDHFAGCQAGPLRDGHRVRRRREGLSRACRPLTTSGGNARERSPEGRSGTRQLRARVRARPHGATSLWGLCKSMRIRGGLLWAGAAFTAHAVLGAAGEQPLLPLPRARAWQKEGLRERLVPAAPAPGRPFDNGLFEIAVEPFDAPDPQDNLPAERLVQLDRRPRPANVRLTST
jgi:hypothetical protein